MAGIMEHPLWMTWVRSCRAAGIESSPQHLVRSFRRFLADTERAKASGAAGSRRVLSLV
ncbi:hypothetical protein [Streptomyces sp. NPDC000961]|uniref:hypothetical protein n=1 Tax=Streptomyces sp. NPDC000961 TaxID=3364541 RepID=UPI0036970192